MPCFTPVWFEVSYLLVVFFLAWMFLTTREEAGQTGAAVFALKALMLILSLVLLFWLVEFAAMVIATGMYDREAGVCGAESKQIIRLGLLSLLWIGPFVVACLLVGRTIWKSGAGRP